MKGRLSWCYEKEEAESTSPNTQKNHCMLYLGIDQHRKQLTVGVRNEEGDVTVRTGVPPSLPYSKYNVISGKQKSGPLAGGLLGRRK